MSRKVYKLLSMSGWGNFKPFSFSFYFLLFSSLCLAQNRKGVEIRVADETGKPALGAAVKNVKTNFATTTDNNGVATVPAANGDVVQILLMGYETAEVKITAQLSYTVKLSSKDVTLDDVVIIGYGAQKKRDVTGAIEKVDISELQKAPVRSFDEALGGRVAGVQVSSTDGQPGSAINITVRGTNSITQGTGPLYVIDGFPLESSNNNVINPADIESMEVLKDASATAIYGARGANGVIIITTKKGKEGPPVIALAASYGIQKIINKAEMMDPYEFVKFQNELDPVSTASIYLKNGRRLDYYKTESGYDWQDQAFKTAPMQNYNLNISGGSQNTKYSFSGSVLKQDGIMIASDYTRYQGRATMDQTVNKNLKVGYNVNYSYLLRRGLSPVQVATLGSSAVLYSILGSRPTFGFADNAENLLFDPATDQNSDYKINPIINLQNTVRDYYTKNLLANVYLEQNLPLNIKLRISGGLNLNTDRNETFNNSQTIFGSLLTNAGRSFGVNGNVNYVENNSWLNENTLSWRKTFAKNHTIDALAGFTLQKNNYSTYGQAAIFIPNEDLGVSGLDEGTPQVVQSVKSVWALASFLGRLNYAYKSKYLATVNFRTDGSSKFAPGNKWSYFPSAALAWRFTEEGFMKSLRWLSDGKLRLSYGQTGNNRVNDFAYLSVITLPIGSSYVINNNYVRGSNVTSIGNLDMKWETTTSTDLGVDLQFLKNRFSFTADVYRKKTKNLLLFANLPLSLGYSSAFKNIGSIQNEGLELTLNGIIIENKNFNWKSSFNISFYRNKVLSLAENQNSFNNTVNWDFGYSGTPGYLTQVGQPLGLMYGYIFDGVYQYSDFKRATSGQYILKDDVATNGNTRSLIQPGDIKYRDINGDNVVDAQDYTVIGRGAPLSAGGFSNSFRYKNFDLSIFFQWSYGNDILNVNRLVFEGNTLNRTSLNQYATYANRWSPENQGSDIPRAKGIPNNSPYSSRYVEDGSYLRLKTLNIGYRLPMPWMKKQKIREFRVYVSAQNLLTWTNYSGFDPEVSTYNSVLTPGFDYSAYPRSRNYTMGLNVSF